MKQKKSHSPIQDFLALPDEEKERIVAEFDQEFIADTFRPLTPAERKKWQRIQRGLQRSRRQRVKKTISVSMDSYLLRESDALAKRKGVSRSELIARGLQRLLASER